ncbi:MAG: glycosyltransferase family 1 protein [Candidatus Aceula meridiana]|nr:glycosyltransferase family 1 protein [Candidatus Aceula meridiana]
MRIAINCRSFSKKNYTGIGRYAFNLVDCLAKMDKENEYYLYARKSGFFDFKRKLPQFSAKNFYRQIDYSGKGLGPLLKKVDLYHSPSLDFLPETETKIVVTVHDLIYKACSNVHTPDSLEIFESQFQQITAKAAKVICCSENTRKDLHRFFSIDENKTCVVYNGVDKSQFYPLSDEEKKQAASLLGKKGIEGPFILFVGTVEPRKNLKNLIKAFKDLKKKKKFSGKLVVCGMKGWMTKDIEEEIRKENLSDDILRLGYVSNLELRCLYNLAEVFVFSSFYEGFGFPILEAFSCGCAVVTSNTSSCVEIASDAALTVSPSSWEEIARGIEKIREDGQFKSALQQKALKRADDFSFAKTAQQTLNVYQEVVNK